VAEQPTDIILEAHGLNLKRKPREHEGEST
jgi:hypothetical protein